MPPGSDLAAWLGTVHPAYLKYVLAIVVIGSLVGALAYLDLKILSLLIESLAGASPAPGAVTPWFEQTVKQVISATGFRPTLAILGLYCINLGLRAGVSFMQQHMIGRLELASKNDIEREVLRNLLRKDDRFYQEHSASVVTNRLAEDSRMITERRRNLTELWFRLVSVAGYFWFFVQTNLILTAVGFGAILLGVGMVNWLMRAMPQIQGRQLQTDDAVKSALEDYLLTTPEVQVSNLHRPVIERFEDVQDVRRNVFLRLVTLNGKLAMSYGLSYLVSFSAFVFTIIWLKQGATGPGEIVKIIPIVLRTLPEVFQSISEMALLRMRMRLATPSVYRLLEYASPPLRRAPPPAAAKPEVPPPPSVITFEGVNYRFDPQGPLQGGKVGISVTIEPRSLVAVVGPSGSGKTMLCQLMLGRLPAEEGSVTYGDRPVAEMSPEERALRFAYMPQANALLDSTIADNLLFTRPGPRAEGDGFAAPEREVLERTGVALVALEKALEMLPDGPDVERISSADLASLRTRLQERVAKALGVELVRLGEGRAAPSHAVVDHLLAGASDREFVLGLSRSPDARKAFDALAGTKFGAALVALAIKIIGDTEELLSSVKDVEAYNRVTPFPLEAEIWDLRRRLVNIPESAARGSARLPLLALGLLACPNEFDARWTPGSPDGPLPPPDPAFVERLRALMGDAVAPFEPDHINRRLCWRDNLLFAAPALSNSRLQAEIDHAILDEISGSVFNEVLTGSGFAYLVGRQGKKLSGGQRQRVCLGRTLLQDVGVYILDEPTSALDPRSRRLVNEYLKQRAATSTVIAITHDRDLAEAADQVLMVQDGRLHASGKFATLIEKNEDFRRIIGSA